MYRPDHQLNADGKENSVNNKTVKVTLTMPPSSNHIYINKSGGRIKTAEARAWQNKAVREIIEQAKLGFQENLDQNKQYALLMTFYFKQIINKGWGEIYKKGDKKGQRKSQNKWKRVDLSNRVKLAEDAMKIATGVDDSSTMASILIKTCDPQNPRLYMELIELVNEEKND